MADTFISLGYAAGRTLAAILFQPGLVNAWNFTSGAYDAAVNNAAHRLALTEGLAGAYSSADLSAVSHVPTVSPLAVAVYDVTGTPYVVAGPTIAYWTGTAFVSQTGDAYAAANGVPAALLSTNVDTIPLSTLLTEVLSAADGKVGVTNNGDGTYTLAFKKRDGTTTAATRTYNPTTGART